MRPPHLCWLWFSWTHICHQWLFSNTSQQPMACDSSETKGAAPGSSIPWSHLGSGWEPQGLRSGPGLQWRFGAGFTGGHSELLMFSGPWHWALLWAGPHVPEIPWAFLLSVLQLAFISPSIWVFPVGGILILVLQEALSSMDHSANLSSFATHLTLCTEPGSFYDSISLPHIGWRLLGQDWKISQRPKEQKLQFFSM